MINAIKKAGGRPRYTEYPDAAHGIWEEVIKTPGLLDWLFYQKQTDHPKAAKKALTQRFRVRRSKPRVMSQMGAFQENVPM